MIVINITGHPAPANEWKCDVVGDTMQVHVAVGVLYDVNEETPEDQIDSNVDKLVTLAGQLDELANAVLRRLTDRGLRYIAINPPDVMAAKLDVALREIGLTPVRSKTEAITSNGEVRPVHRYWVENSADLAGSAV
jgi:hypothetical protein